MSEPGLLASDAERDAAVERLRQGAAEGRLSADELEERVERAFRARTHGELDAILADLPRPRRARRRSKARRAELTVFAWTAVLLIGIWALSGMGYFWPAWPILGWGFFILVPCGSPSRSHHRRRRATA